ncbi:MAG: hypothetical protein ACLRQF_01935 [Thomasclavelia ramosa]
MREWQRRKEKGMFSKLTSKGIILTIQLIASAVFLGYIYVLKMLPTRYYAILIIVLIALLLLEMIWITSEHEEKEEQEKALEFLLVSS